MWAVDFLIKFYLEEFISLSTLYSLADVFYFYLTEFYYQNYPILCFDLDLIGFTKEFILFILIWLNQLNLTDWQLIFQLLTSSYFL